MGMQLNITSDEAYRLASRLAEPDILENGGPLDELTADRLYDDKTGLPI